MVTSGIAGLEDAANGSSGSLALRMVVTDSSSGIGGDDDGKDGVLWEFSPVNVRLDATTTTSGVTHPGLSVPEVGPPQPSSQNHFLHDFIPQLHLRATPVLLNRNQRPKNRTR